MTTPPTKKAAMDSQSPTTAAQQEQPQRSRNARAQARHRAKRKAYIEQLEETVTKLQAALNLTPEQVAALPPTQVRIRDLEQENMRLRSENDNLRMKLDAYIRGHPPPPGRRGVTTPIVDFVSDDRDKKRGRRHSGSNDLDSAYLTPGGTPPHMNTSLTRPSPLSLPIPHSNSHHPSYPSMASASGSGLGSSSSLYPPVQPSGYTVPGTPSGSSSSSTTPFSGTKPSLPPVEIPRGRRAGSVDPPDFGRSPYGHQNGNYSHNGSFSSGGSHMHLPVPNPSGYGHSLPPFSSTSPYDVVPKTEEDYPMSAQSSNYQTTLPPPFPSGSTQNNNGNSWSVQYSAERAPNHHT